jgi:hypothetical protein
MKKTLLIAAAALVAGVITSEAQVYSVNVVGYINVDMPAGQQVLVANPLDDGTNTVTSLGSQLQNKSQIQVWNGTGFTGTSKTAGAWGTPNLSIPVGTGFFVKSFTHITNTFVGNVIVGPGNSVTNALPAGALVLVGNAIPYSGDLLDTNVNLGPTLANKSQIQIWNGTGYTGSTKTAGVWGNNFTLSAGEGYFVKSFTAVNWVETLH